MTPLPSLDQKQNLPLSAVFVDVENMAVSGPNGLAAFEISRVMSHVEESTRPVLRRAYADWAKLRTFRASLLKSGFDQVQATYMNQSKNGLDMQMSLDALETCLTDKRMEIYYLITADSDFGPLARALRRHGRFVVGVGWREKTNDIFRQHCDLFVDYDELSGQPIAESHPNVEPTPPPERRARPPRPERVDRHDRIERHERMDRPGRAAFSGEESTSFFMHDPRYGADHASDPEPEAVQFTSNARPVQRAARPPRRPVSQVRDLADLNSGIAALVDEQGSGARLNPSQFQRAIRRVDPGFTPMAFGYGSMPEFVEAHPLLSRDEINGGPPVIVLPDASMVAAALAEANRQAEPPPDGADNGTSGWEAEDSAIEGVTADQVDHLAANEANAAAPRPESREPRIDEGGSNGARTPCAAQISTAAFPVGKDDRSDANRLGSEPAEDDGGDDDQEPLPIASLRPEERLDRTHDVALSASSQSEPEGHDEEHRQTGWWQRR